MAGHGRFRVEQLATDLGWSRQRLWSRFGSQLGLTPKRAARLVRFDHAVHRLVHGHSPARVAAETGYADQSHLTRDATSAHSPAPHRHPRPSRRGSPSTRKPGRQPCPPSEPATNLDPGTGSPTGFPKCSDRPVPEPVRAPPLCEPPGRTPRPVRDSG
ncbi:helix-turn-helix domain-containing protein [Nocardia seriolae]|nr:helix-turn-helix domain-containing protein [Nocardia seriolae]WKY56275.1 helix-turn-helix domain-containing protein [Nocardia seriolae]WNJ63023.1 helix-turn-helix domain-containing protein [Nocardia seriolae]